MPWKQKHVLALALILVSVAIAVQAGPATDAIDNALSTAVLRGDVPGVVAIAATRGGIIYEGAFGKADVGNNRAMTTDALFRIASMTKGVTAVAAMQLVEKGLVKLDDPVAKYFPDLSRLFVFESFDSKTGNYSVRPPKNTLTVRHLFAHSSGLGYPFTSTIVRDFKPRPGEQYAAGPLLFEPGEGWHYGTSTDWLGRLVEVVSGQNLEDYFRSRIFEPLGMRDTFYNVPGDKQPRLVTNHRRQLDGALVEQPTQAPRLITQFNGGGGLSSTAGDYMTFLRMLLNGGELNGKRILSGASVSLMGQNQIGSIGVAALKTALPQTSNDFTFIADGRDKWGLGFLITTDRVPGKRAPGSLSWGGVNNTYFWLDPASGVAGVIMMQVLPFADTKALALYEAFERAVYASAGSN
jgi:CubicO group peptidase (beta-lactamase class C family)